MSKYKWKPFLEKWSREIVASDDFTYFINRLGNDYPGSYTPEVLSSGWLGYPGATEKEILQKEAYLGINLPPSYREFLKVTDGWKTIEFEMIPRIWSVAQIEWLKVTEPDWVWEEVQNAFPVSDEDYFVYDNDESLYYRGEYFETALDISDREYAGTAKYLLNPQIINKEGEWEAWFYAHWLPGVIRYPSFWEMMQGRYKTFLYLQNNPSNE
ncbi:MAG: SMI1/KNR4 family protein [Chloroflexi bacterium]|nr:SMI1/KNR4 family protein [Chloroflexota bacterium]